MFAPFRTLARAMVCALALCSMVRADVPRTIAFQGTLKDVTGTPLTVSRQVTFTLYDAATEGTPLWTETQTVTPANGLFAVPLGSVTPLSLPFDKPYWVGIKVGDDAEMVPRVPLNSAPYALALPNVVTLQGGGIDVGGPIKAVGPSVGGLALRLGGADVPMGLSTEVGGTTPLLNLDVNFRGDHQDPNTQYVGGAIRIDARDSSYPLFSFLSRSPNETADQVVMSIQRNGNVGIGVRSPSAKLSLPVRGTGNTILIGDPNDLGLNNFELGIALPTGSQHWPLGVTVAGATVFGVDQYGSAYVHGLSASTLTVNGPAQAQTLTLTSSRRYKRDVQPLTNALGTLSQLQGVSYVWDEQHGGKADIGFIAEDAGKVVPELVTWEPNGVDAVGMDYSHLTALTVEGIKEQQTEIESLKAENADLKARLERLEALVAGGGPR